MDAFASAQQIYLASRKLLDGTREVAVQHHLLRWLREDLEESLLDLKLAVIDGDRQRLRVCLDESKWLLAELRRLLVQLDEGK